MQQQQQQQQPPQYYAGNEGMGLGMGGMQQQQPVVDPDDPLLIAQSLTYVTDDGSVLLSYQSAPFSTSFKIRFVILEAIFVAILIAAVPIGAHGVVLGISLGNLGVIAWFWYNSVRSVEVTVDGGLRFWIGNFEVDVPFDKIMSMRRISGECSLIAPNLLPHRGYLTSPTDGVAIVTSVPSTPFWMWPRSAGRPERRLGPFTCPRLIVVFSPTGGSLSFIREVEAEMRGDGSGGEGRAGRVQPPAYVAAAGGSGGLGLQPPVAATADLIDV